MKRNIVFFLGLFLIIMACGGDEDPMEATCDTTDMTYTDDIATIMTGTCATNSSCHVDGGQTPELFSYAKIKEHIDTDNRIIGAINHQEDFIPMPYPEESDKLSDCNIDKIEAWIAAGAPE